MVTGGLRLGQTEGDQPRGVRQGGQTGGDQTRGVRQGGQTGADQTRGQVRPGQSKMPTDGLTSSISRFGFAKNIYFWFVPLLNCPIHSFLRKTDHFTEDYKQVLSQILNLFIV